MEQIAKCGPVTLVILQPTSLCNLNCRYCYVADRKNSARMDEGVLELAFAKILQSEHARGRRIEFLWHAGEPLTVGIDYFRRAIELSERYRRPDTTVLHAVQTNGVLVTPEWASFFKENRFKLGVSIDGPAFLHDRNRCDWAGHGSFSKSLRGFRILQEASVQVGALAVVTRETLDYPDELFHFFVDSEICSFGLNTEEVENVNTETSFGSNNAAPPLWLRRRFEEFFGRLFDLWWPVRDFVCVREIRDVVRAIQLKRRDPDYCRHPDESAEMGIITILKTGDISTFSPELAGAIAPAYDNFIVGNVAEIDSIDAIREHSVYRAMRRDINLGRKMCAESCHYFDFCGSAFVSNRYFETGRLDGTESTTCILQRQIVVKVVIERLQAMSELGAAAASDRAARAAAGYA